MTASDSGHEHTFTPVEGEMGLYRCACGATGYRASDGLRAHVKPRTVREQPSVRLAEGTSALAGSDWHAPGGSWVEPKKGAE